MQSQDVLDLIAQRDHLERELNDLRLKLIEGGDVGGLPLVDADGFPRGDVDVPSMRAIRIEVIRKENDINALTERISQGLRQVLKPDGSSAGANNNSTAKSKLAQPAQQELEPFATINSVATGSPAEQAGLLAGDQILRFGDVTKSITAMALLPGEAKRPDVLVKLLRDGKQISTHVHPRLGWGGPGTLGCRFDKITQ